MKQGRSITELAQEIERQQESKRDFVSAGPKLEVKPIVRNEEDGNGNGKPYLEPHKLEIVVADEEFPMTEVCGKQVANKLSIPTKYWQHCLDQGEPALLAQNANVWLRRDRKKHMVRTLDGGARAFLSDRYKRIDHIDLLGPALESITNIPGAKVVSCQVTDLKLYLKFVIEGMEREIKGAKVGDMVRAGGIIGNSEIGFGQYFVNPLVEVLACTNGMVINKAGMSGRHVGSRIGNGADVQELYQDDTIAADDRALMLRVRDTVNNLFDEKQFAKVVEMYEEAAQNKIEGDPVEAVELTQKTFRLHDGERKSVLRHLIEGGDLSQWGLSNAITRTSQDLESYDRATELEVIGHDVIELPKNQWKQIAEAA